MLNPKNYWNAVAHQKTFTHPLDIDLLKHYISSEAQIIDYGCGYGRLVDLLHLNGFEQVLGFDISVELIHRGRNNGIKNLHPIDSVKSLPIADQTIDCFIVFAVFTCIPDNASQLELIETIYRKLKPGGIIYVSDYYIQENSVEVSQYNYLHNDETNFGVFTLPDDMMFRHHTKHWINQLFHRFTIIHETKVEVQTMNGNRAEAFQIIAKK